MREQQQYFTSEFNPTQQIVHSRCQTLLVEEEREGVNAVNDFGQVLAIVKVDRLESEDLSCKKRAQDEPSDMRERQRDETYVG